MLHNGIPPQLEQLLGQAMNNPDFVNQFARSNPHAFQQAMQMRNTMSPRDAIMKIAQEKGIDPTLLMQRFGIH